jgi:ABC-type transport system involved in multi-copper enzyme maturation permease subunit
MSELNQAGRRRLTPWTAVTLSVGWVTFREVIRDKILYNILVVAVLLLGLGFLASKLTFVRPDRVVLDFGISAVGLSSVAIAILIGAGMVNRELERRTIFLALSRPISRFQFIAGKFLGLILVLILNWILLCSAFLLILGLSSGGDSLNFHPTLFAALLLLLCQSIMMGGLAIFISTFSTTSLSAVMSIGVFLIGNNISQIHAISSRIHHHIGAFALDSIAFVVPNLEYFNLGTKVTYGIPVSLNFMAVSLGYAAVVSVGCLVLAGIFIHQKEV